MSYWFSFVFPWLLVVWFLQTMTSWLARCRGAILDRTVKRTEVRAPGWRTFLCLAVVSLAIVLLPVRGIALGRWLAALNLHPSMPLLGFLAAVVWRNGFRQEIDLARESQAAWIFGSLAGAVLYPLSMGLGNFDPYAWGWRLSVLFPLVGLITFVFIWKGNRFGLLLVLSIIGFDLRWLESINLWDYLIDPLYWLLSLAMLTKATLGKFVGQRLRPGDAVEPQIKHVHQ